MGTQLRGALHLIFRNRNLILDVYDEGNVDMVPLGDLDEKQTIDDVMDVYGDMDKLITKMGIACSMTLTM